MPRPKKPRIIKPKVMYKENGQYIGGRKPKDLDEGQIRELAKIQCTYAEIAAVMRCDQDTICNRFSEIIKEERENGRASLRRVQFAKALDGNVPLLIWLGKHILGQKDEVHLTTTEPEVRELLRRWEIENSSNLKRSNKQIVVTKGPEAI